jgi:uncharacterized membrane protein YphA (DoxX/SURF4 family)
MPRYTVKTILFLILLRLAIGWHFFAEGRHKFQTWMKGNAQGNRPFSSEGYFRESTGPLAPFIRNDSFLGDPDEKALALLTPAPLPADADPRSVSPSKRVPAAGTKEWDDYLARFTRHFDLSLAETKDAENRVNQAKYQLGLWLTTDANGLTLPQDKIVDLTSAKETALSILGNVPVPGIKEERKLFGGTPYEVKKTTSQRLNDYRKSLQELRLVRDVEPWSTGKPPDEKKLARIKMEANRQRQDLLDDLNKHTAALEESLGIILKNRLAEATVSPPIASDPAALLLLTLPPEKKGDEKGPKQLPPDLNDLWDGYARKLVANYKLSDAVREKVEKRLSKSKVETAAWLASADMAGRIRAYDQEVRQVGDAAKRQEMRTALMADVDKRTEGMKAALNRIVSEEKADVAPEGSSASDWSKYLSEHGLAPNPARVRGVLWWVDFLTVWGITILGGMLIVGLFTRTACVLAALFLALTYLAFPPFPWLATPPQNEGNYLYVNKNLIEMLALLVLATTASGRWLGLDAWIHGLFGRRAKPKAEDDKSKKPPKNGSAPKPAPAPVVTAGRSPATAPSPKR